jgi:predicted dehydrogenase
MKKVKWGVLGAGGIADRRTIPGMMLAKNAELVAVMEINMEFAERIRAKYNAKRAYDNTDALLADPEVEAVYIASPVIYHKEQVLKAAKAGKHILCEKPIALSVPACEELVEACNEAGVLSATGFMMRYHAYHQKMKEFISEGKIGDVVFCRGQFSCWYPDMEGAWRQNKKLSGGGALIDMGVHAIDLIQYLTDSKVTKVAALNDTKTFQYSVDDSSCVLMKLSNGATAHVDSNFNIPDAASLSLFEIYGTKGSIIAEGTLSQEEGGKVRFMVSDVAGYDANQNRNQVKPLDVPVTFGNMYTKEIESFSNSILTGAPIQVPMSDALYVQRIVTAAYESGEKEIFVEV